MTGAGRLAACALAAGLAAAAAPAGPPTAAGRGLTRGDLVGRAYDAILDARTEPDRPAARRDVPAGARAGLPRASRGRLCGGRFCRTGTTARTTRRLLTLANETIAAADAWVTREPRRAEAWFYLGAAYAVRLQWRGQRGDRLTAARDGKRVKDALERAIALEPGLDDAYFGVGLYQYYADIMPSVLKILRWLLLLPGGDREKGLGMMLRTREAGEVLRGEADFQLHQIYLWYENRPDRALETAGGAAHAVPTQPDLPPAHGRDARPVPARPGREPGAFASSPHSAIAARWAGRDRRDAGAARRRRAVPGARGSRPHDRPRAPGDARRACRAHAAAARAHLLVGRAEDSLGHRERALAVLPCGDRGDARRRSVRSARPRPRGMGRAPDARRAEARRLSLEGWRALERGQLAEAGGPLSRAVAINPGDPMARFRLGSLFAARGETGAALAEFERVITARPAAAGVTLADACYEAARLHDAAGNRARAVELFRQAASTRGARATTRERAAARMASR